MKKHDGKIKDLEPHGVVKEYGSNAALGWAGLSLALGLNAVIWQNAEFFEVAGLFAALGFLTLIFAVRAVFAEGQPQPERR